MKKLLAILLSMIMLLSFAACDSSSSSSDDDNESKQSDKDNKDDESEDNGLDDITFEELVVVDNEECVIKITEVEYSKITGYSVKVYLENKSADKNYMFSVDSAAVNGVSSDPFFASEVASGKKANETLTFLDSSLENNGIVKYTDIELSFSVSDADDWLADDVVDEIVHVYPYGEDKAEVYVREAKSTDQVIIDNEYATVIVTGYEVDDIWGYTVNLFLVNKTDTEVMFNAEDVSVNGFMIDPFHAKSVAAGKCAFSSMSWDEASFSDNGIIEVEEIEMIFEIYDSENWDIEDYFNETITLNP